MSRTIQPFRFLRTGSRCPDARLGTVLLLLALFLVSAGNSQAADRTELFSGTISTTALAAVVVSNWNNHVRIAPAHLTSAPQAASDTTSEADADTASVAASLDGAKETAWSIAGKVVASIIVLLLAFYLIRGVVYVLDALSERSATRRLLYKRLVPVTRLVLWFVALYVVVIGVLGIGTRQLVAAGAAIGVAVGFAAQDLLKNVFGGLVILFDQPFQVGDRIEVGATYGEVVSIGLRSTRIVTPDDNLVTVPNAQAVDGQVSNANAGALDCQVVTDLYLPHDADETRAEQLAFEAATNSKYTYLDEPVVVVVEEEVGEKPVLHLKVKAYVLDARHEASMVSDVTKRARRAFREEGLLASSTPSPDPSVDGPAPSTDGASQTHPSPA